MATTSAIMSEDQTIEEPPRPYTVQSWTHSVIRPALIILMVTALMGAIFSVTMIANPDPMWTFGFLICFVVILESYFTTSWLEHPDRRNLNHLAYRAAEIIVIALTLRLLTWIIQGNWPETNNWLNYLKSPFDLFNDGYYWTLLILSLIAWQRIIAITQSFNRMKPDEAEIAYYSLPRQKRNPGDQPISDNRTKLLSGFSQQFLGGGIVVLLCAALTTFNLTELLDVVNPFTTGLARLGLSPAMLTSLILYFLCGFLLLSQGRLAILEIRWLAGDVAQQTPIGRHWHRRALFMLLAIAFIAAFIPVGSTLPFTKLLSLIIYGIVFAVTTFFNLFALLLYFLLSLLFPFQAGSEEAPSPPPASPPPQLAPQQTLNNMQYVFSSAFWAIALIASVIAISFFLKERGIKFNSHGLQRLWLTLKLWWQQLRQGINDQVQDIQGGLQSVFNRGDGEGLEKKRLPWQFIRVNSLSPREKVYYFYLSTIKRADQRGVTRQESETPLEFINDLKTNWPDAEEEIEELTEAFLHARYSPSPIEEDEVTPIQKQWKRLKSNLRKRKKGG